MLYRLHDDVQCPPYTTIRSKLLITVESVLQPEIRPIDLHHAADVTLLRIHPGTQVGEIIHQVTDEHRDWRAWATEAGCPPHLHPLQWWDPHVRLEPENIPPQMRLIGHEHDYIPTRLLSA